MRLIKKYANRKLYDTHDKQYVTMEDLASLVKSGAEIKVIDNETGDDLTTQLLSRLLAKDNRDEKGLSANLLMQLLRKGGGTLSGYGRKYAALWQSAFVMSREEIEKRINRLVSEREISETDGRNLKKEIFSHVSGLREWVRQHVDQRLNETFSMFRPASREQVNTLSRRVALLNDKIRLLEAQLEVSKKKERCRTQADRHTDLPA